MSVRTSRARRVAFTLGGVLAGFLVGLWFGYPESDYPALDLLVPLAEMLAGGVLGYVLSSHRKEV